MTVLLYLRDLLRLIFYIEISDFMAFFFVPDTPRPVMVTCFNFAVIENITITPLALSFATATGVLKKGPV